jgi:hypothetical protein
VGRLLRQIEDIEKQAGDRPIVVAIPELIKEHWWDYVLLGDRARRLRAALLRRGGPDLAVVIVSWARGEPHPERIVAEEEPEPDSALARSTGSGSYFPAQKACFPE